MTKDQIMSGLKRFLKGFVAGGLAQVVLIINAGTTIHNLADVHAILTAIIAGFISGGLLGIQKMMSWQEFTPPDDRQ